MTSLVSPAIVVASGGSAASSPFPGADAFAGAAGGAGGAGGPGAASEAVLGVMPCTGRAGAAVDAAAKPSAKRGAATPFADALALEWAAALATGAVQHANVAASPAGDEKAPDEEAVEATEAEGAIAAVPAPAASPSPASVTAAPVPPLPRPEVQSAPAPETRSSTRSSAPLAATVEAGPPLPPPPLPRGERGATTVAPALDPVPPPSAPSAEPSFIEEGRADATESAAPQARTVEIDSGTHVTFELLRAAAQLPRRDGGFERGTAETAEREPVRSVLDEVELRSWPRAAAGRPLSVDGEPVAAAHALGNAPAAAPALTPRADAPPVTAPTEAPHLGLPTAPKGADSASAAASRPPTVVASPPATPANAAPAASAEAEAKTPGASAGAAASTNTAPSEHAGATNADAAHATDASSGNHRRSAATGQAAAGDPSDESPPWRDPESGARDSATAASASPTARRRDDPAARPPLASRAGEAALQDAGPHAPSDAPRAAPATAAPDERAAGDAASPHPTDPATGATPPSSLRMTLEPADGPRLEVRLEMRGEAVHASIVTGDDALRTELSSGRDDLRDHLRQQHLELGGFDVSTGTGGHGATERDARDARDGLPFGAQPPPPPRATGPARAVLDGTAPATGLEGHRRALDVTV
ncbi:MAG: flagellar hook-length control protein FliK [Deltaproteobacteria bacterium]|nr:flagellar hook-length control protein FliK [Deltaproteobacteria bacterium]